ncbi:MAG: prolyl oligopeptidase family serine peptidase [Verrucomicrobiales bacterium]
MTAKSFNRRGFFLLLLKTAGWTALVLVLAVGSLLWYFNPPVEREEDLVYARRDGRDLTLDAIRPGNPNGLGVILVLSGRWRSKPDSDKVWLVAPLLRRGYTILAVSHVSQPEATVMEIERDMHRAVRFIRANGESLGVNPERLGVVGGSSGGHLGLMLATRGGPGDPESADPVGRESSAVKAAAVFFPVTDLLNLGSSTENPGDGGPPKSFVDAFGPDASDLEKWKRIGRDISPIHHIHAKQAPILIFHGDADTLVPLEQSRWFVDKATGVGATVELFVRENQSHGWLTMPLDIHRMGRWFDAHL